MQRAFVDRFQQSAAIIVSICQCSVTSITMAHVHRSTWHLLNSTDGFDVVQTRRRTARSNNGCCDNVHLLPEIPAWCDGPRQKKNMLQAICEDGFCRYSEYKIWSKIWFPYIFGSVFDGNLTFHISQVKCGSFRSSCHISSRSCWPFFFCQTWLNALVSCYFGTELKSCYHLRLVVWHFFFIGCRLTYVIGCSTSHKPGPARVAWI